MSIMDNSFTNLENNTIINKKECESKEKEILELIKQNKRLEENIKCNSL